jgi:hypothetical protein
MLRTYAKWLQGVTEQDIKRSGRRCRQAIRVNV